MVEVYTIIRAVVMAREGLDITRRRIATFIY